MSNEDNKEFEFIERSGSPNKRPQGSRPSSRSIKMWVLFEGKEDAKKFVLKEDDFKDLEEFYNADLDDFKNVLHKHYSILKSIENEDIVFFDENLERLDPRTNLSSLDVGKDSSTKIIVRYPLSDLSIKANLKFVNNRKEEFRIKHTTGSFNMLQVEAKSKFESLADCKLSDIYFEHQGEKIENAYHFKFLVEKFKEMGKNELSLDLKVLIRNRKPFSDWKLEEVLKNIYNYESNLLELVSDNFNMESLPQLSSPLSDELLNKIVEQLNDRKFVFDKVNVNEATAREFISTILVNAVCYVKKNNDKTAMLMVEKQIVGSHGYGPLDYVVMIQKFFVLVTEAKPHDPEKGIAQNLAQLDSMSELLGKRKIDQTDIEYESIEKMPIIGIVTTGRTWIFIRHTCQAESRRLEISDEFECKFTGNSMKDDVKPVVTYVVRLLQAQIRELEQRKSKRSRGGVRK